MTQLPGSTLVSRNAARLSALASGMTPSRARPNPRSSTSTAPANSTFPSAPRPGTPGSGPPRKLSSTSTSPRNRSPGPYHHRAVPMQHRPSGLDRAQLHLTAQLGGRDAGLAVDQQPRRCEPNRQRRAGLVEDRAGGRRDLPLAGAAQPPGVGQTPPREAAATRADEPVWPAKPVQVVQALPVLVEPGTQLCVGPRVVPSSDRAHRERSMDQEYLSGNPLLTHCPRN